MNRRRALRLSLVALAVLLVLVLAAGTTLTTVLVRRPFPQRDGEVTLPGLSAPVRVLRDGQGVPQIYAATSADLFRAQGWVTASDRFFQMDVRRRLASGRLAELLGDHDGAVQADALMRTLGLRRVAERELSGLDEGTRAALQAYADGVNDYLRGRSPGQLSLHYTVLSRKHDLPAVEEWTPVDSLAWLKALAWDLKQNDRAQLGRARAFATVRDVRRVEQLYPAFPADLNRSVLPGAQADQPQADQPQTEQPQADQPQPEQPQAAEPTRTTSGSRLPVTATKPADPDDESDLGAALSSASGTRALQAVSAVVGRLPGGVGGAEAVGSHTWAVAGSLTASGHPLLMDDLHLATAEPSALYQVGLHCTSAGSDCPYDVAGFTFAALPGVLAGHNAKVAWGLSGLAADTSDLYLERLSADGRGFERDGQTLPLDTRTEEIKIAGASSRTITVRSTGHGPLISDVAAAAGEGADDEGQVYAVSLAWTALEPGTTLDGVLALDRAGDAGAVQAAAALLQAPAEAVVYADAEHVGFVAAGAVPTRKGGRSGPFSLDGSWPLPGWTTGADWTGTVEASKLPRLRDPADGLVVAANQEVSAPADGGSVDSADDAGGDVAGSDMAGTAELGRDADPGFRAQRIRDLVERAGAAGRKLGLADVERIQSDTRSPVAAVLVPLLLRTKVDAFTEDAQDLLRGWDYTQPEDSAAAAYFNAVWSTLLDLTFADELPAGARPDGGARWVEVVRQLVAHPDDPWWDDRRTPGVVETRDAILQRALQSARLRLTSRIGKDPSTWRWGKLHTVTLAGDGGHDAQGVLGRRFDRGPIAAPGGSSAVNTFAWDAAQGYTVVVAPAMRMVVDLGNLDASRWVNSSGESGHPYDDHSGDQVDAWLEGRTYPWPSGRTAVDAATDDELTLTPTD